MPAPGTDWPVSRTRFFTCCPSWSRRHRRSIPLSQQCLQCSQSLRSTDTARDRRQCPLTVRSAPVPRHRSEVFLSVPQRSPAVCSACLLSLTLRSSREQCSAAAMSTPLCFPPFLHRIPCSFRSPVCSLSPHLQCTSLIVTPPSSPSFPLYALFPLSC